MKAKNYTKKLFCFVLSLLMIFIAMFVSSTVAFASEETANVMKSYTAASTDDYHAFRKKVVTITFLDAIDESSINSDDTLYKCDVSAAENGSVVAWMKLNETETDYAGENRYDVYVAADGGVTANDDSSYLFYNFAMLKEINGLEHLHTDNVTDMRSMFENCNSLTELDVSHFNVSNAITKLYKMFYANIKSLNISGWNFKNIPDNENLCQYYLFDEYNSPKSIIAENLYLTQHCTKLFSGLRILETLNLNSIMFDTTSPDNLYGGKKVRNLSYMFENCNNLKTINLEGWDVSIVTHMSYMFNNCYALTELDLSSFHTPNLSYMPSMFAYCSSLRKIYVGSGWQKPSMASHHTFDGCVNLSGKISFSSSKTTSYYATTDYYMTHIDSNYSPEKPINPPDFNNSNTENLNFFEKIIQWFKNLFAKLFSF